MANKVSYLYTARDKKSFDFLAVDAAKSGATVTIDPEKQTILLTTTEDKINGTSEDPVYNLRDIIHSNELDVVVQLVDDAPDILKQIADLTKENEVLANDKRKADEDKKFYQDLYLRASDYHGLIKKRIGAIATLIEAIDQ